MEWTEVKPKQKHHKKKN